MGEYRPPGVWLSLGTHPEYGVHQGMLISKELARRLRKLKTRTEIEDVLRQEGYELIPPPGFLVGDIRIAPENAEKAVLWAEEVFEGVAAIVPRRIYQEDVGEAMEFIRYEIWAGRPPHWIYLKMISLIFWILINSVREIVSAFRGTMKKTGR